MFWTVVFMCCFYCFWICYVFLLFFEHFLKFWTSGSIFDFQFFITKNTKNSYFWWFWDPGSMLKRLFIAKRFIFHVSKSILVPKMISQCALRNLVALRGQKSRKKRNLRIQGRMHIFEKISQKALNRVLTLPDYSIWPELLISSGIIDLQNNFIILVRKQHKYRISVPMLYIAFIQTICTCIAYDMWVA